MTQTTWLHQGVVGAEFERKLGYPPRPRPWNGDDAMPRRDRAARLLEFGVGRPASTEDNEKTDLGSGFPPASR